MNQFLILQGEGELIRNLHGEWGKLSEEVLGDIPTQGTLSRTISSNTNSAWEIMLNPKGTYTGLGPFDCRIVWWNVLDGIENYQPQGTFIIPEPEGTVFLGPSFSLKDGVAEKIKIGVINSSPNLTLSNVAIDLYAR